MTVRYWEKYQAAKRAIATLRVATADGTIPSDVEYHVVEPGESLGVVARKHGVTTDVLVAMNPGLNPDLINYQRPA